VTALLLAAGEPSKTPFYIAGAVLVIWALVLAGLGLTRPAFPYGARGARLVMGGSFVLMVIAMGLAVATSGFPTK
jgi:hypothetical protein